MARTNFAELNSTIRYTMWSVFRVEPERLPDERAAAGAETRDYLESLVGKGVVVRGVYDLGPAGGRRLHDLVARRGDRGAAAGLYGA